MWFCASAIFMGHQYLLTEQKKGKVEKRKAQEWGTDLLVSSSKIERRHHLRLRISTQP
jgi:hypothetical protein